MKTQKIIAVLALVLGLATAASAEEYGFKQNPANNTSLFADNNGSWTNNAGTAASSLTSSDILHICGSTCSLKANSTFDGEFHAGAESGNAATINLIGTGYAVDATYTTSCAPPPMMEDLGLGSVAIARPASL